jgi:hypothetical protein
VIILLVGTAKTDAPAVLLEAQEKRQQLLRNLLGGSIVWGGMVLERNVGAILYKKNRVSDIRRLGVQQVGNHRYTSVEVVVKEGYMSKATAVAVAVCYRVTQNLKRDAPWPRHFIATVMNRVREESVRFLGGVFDCPSEQVAALSRSCGACTFAQVFKETSLGITKYVFYPSLLFCIGGASCTQASTADQPERLAWLCAKGDGETSALVLATRELRDMPTWAQDPAIANEHYRLLGNVTQRSMDVSWWKPWTHQLVLYVGSSRPGEAAVERKRAKTAAAAHRTTT